MVGNISTEINEYITGNVS